MIFSIKFLQVLDKQKEARAAVPYFGSCSGRQFYLGSGALGAGSATLVKS
jgi:hypothetical protein